MEALSWITAAFPDRTRNFSFSDLPGGRSEIASRHSSRKPKLQRLEREGLLGLRVYLRVVTLSLSMGP